MLRTLGAYLAPWTFFDASKEDLLPNSRLWLDHASWRKVVASFAIKDGAKLEFTKDGLVGVSFAKAMADSEARVTFVAETINWFLSCVVLGGGNWFHPVTTGQVTVLNSQGDNIVQASGGGGEYFQVSIDKTVFWTLPPSRELQVLWIALHKRSMEVRAFTNAFEVGKQIYGKFTDVSFDLFLSALSAFASHDWRRALIFSWVVTEQLLQDLWDRYILSATSGKRRDRLSEDRTYSIAVRIEILLWVDKIPEKSYQDLNEIRVARNNMVHEGKNIARETALLSLGTVQDLLVILAGHPIEIKLPETTYIG